MDEKTVKEEAKRYVVYRGVEMVACDEIRPEPDICNLI